MVDFNRLKKPVLISGISLGVLFFIPILQLLGCIWLLVFGFFSAYLFKEENGEIKIEDGVLTGAFTGFVAFVVIIIVFIFLGIISLLGISITCLFGTIEETIISMFFSSISIVFMGFILILAFPVFGIVGAIGGIIGAVLLQGR